MPCFPNTEITFNKAASLALAVLFFVASIQKLTINSMAELVRLLKTITGAGSLTNPTTP